MLSRSLISISLTPRDTGMIGMEFHGEKEMVKVPIKMNLLAFTLYCTKKKNIFQFQLANLCYAALLSFLFQSIAPRNPRKRVEVEVPSL